MVNQDIRWQQRFENFSKACRLLVVDYKAINHRPLREHIDRFGVELFSRKGGEWERMTAALCPDGAEIKED